MELRYIDPSKVVRHREKRQRRKLVVDDLVASIQQNEAVLSSTMGLIYPIVLRSGDQLVAGERRLEAFLRLGRPLIPYYLIDDLPEDDAQILELEENLKRLDLSWQEKVYAYDTIHSNLVKKAGEAEWTQEQTAVRLGVSAQTMSFSLTLATEMKINPELALAASASTAYNMIQRSVERHLDDIATNITMTVRGIVAPKAPTVTVPASDGPKEPGASPPAPVSTVPAKPELRYADAAQSIICDDFISWSRTYKGPRFNLIHCDFPYDAGASKKNTQIHAGKGHIVYEDSQDIFEDLSYALLDSMSNVIAGSAHIVFWFQTGQWFEVANFFQGVAKDYGLTVFDTPLIWHKTDSTGVISDASRRYRHIYETALLLSRGDRKIVRTVGDVHGCPVTRVIHPSEKPEPMLRHFFRALVSNTTRLLDPTAGSGTALRAAEDLGAEFVFGIEKDPKFHQEAVEELNRFRRKRALEALTKPKGAQPEGDKASGPGTTKTGTKSAGVDLSKISKEIERL